MTQETDYQLMVEAIDHMKITPKQKEFVRAAMRVAIEYACMKKAGFDLVPSRRKLAVSEIMTPAEYDDLQIWIRHGRIATGRSYQEEVERCRRIEANDQRGPKATDLCIDCDGSGKYPSGAVCISCDGGGRVFEGDGVPQSPQGTAE